MMLIGGHCILHVSPYKEIKMINKHFTVQKNGKNDSYYWKTYIGISNKNTHKDSNTNGTNFETIKKNDPQETARSQQPTTPKIEA